MKTSSILSVATCLLLPFQAMGQEPDNSHEQWKTQCGTPTGQERFPIESYEELPQFVKPDENDWKHVKGTCLSWGQTDVRYAKTAVPMSRTSRLQGISGWRGEKVAAQAVVWTKTGAGALRYEISDFKGPHGQVIPADRFETGFVRYVMTDGLNSDGGGCGHRPDHTVYDSTMVADCIDPYLKEVSLDEMNTQAIWLSCRIPEDITPGTYKGRLTVMDGERTIGSLQMNIRADEHVLPAPSQWHFHLDLWQNPFAVARYYQVPVWSREHLEAMRPLMERLAAAGQKVITASIMHKPWNGQTHDWFESMVTWIKKLDGSWEFKYDVFDRWVEFMMSCGIDKEINCYSMVPWALTFRYYDQATDSMQSVETAPGEPEYEEMWTSMLKSFASHLKEKGWFDICTIAMDERPMEVMRKTIAVIRKADPDFKISLAGTYHPEIEDQLYDYCLKKSSKGAGRKGKSAHYIPAARKVTLTHSLSPLWRKPHGSDCTWPRKTWTAICDGPTTAGLWNRCSTHGSAHGQEEIPIWYIRATEPQCGLKSSWKASRPTRKSGFSGINTGKTEKRKNPGNWKKCSHRSVSMICRMPRLQLL